ncbi:MAG: hypothetical protein LBU27_03040 [Candidatus Peribacteria bacterium]|nr:hypothetical protein [Candidatus Peribacteria bacterium]
MGVGPKAIVNATTGIQELYLISQDGKSRLFFRRNLVMTGDFDDDNLANSTGEKLYVIQILRLRGFDAGTKHNFSITEGSSNPGLYDGQIDTWACDYSQGFFGH